jgi:hypothetical protein
LIVVSDMTPLQYLVLIGCDHILPRLYERIFTAPAVMKEMDDQDRDAKVAFRSAKGPESKDSFAERKTTIADSRGKAPFALRKDGDQRILSRSERRR